MTSDEANKLEAQLERDALDAARYRWLRDQVDAESIQGYFELPLVFAWDIKPGPQLNERFESLDAAIDSAIEQAAKEKANG